MLSGVEYLPRNEIRKNGHLLRDHLGERFDIVLIVDSDRISKIRRAHVIDVFTHHVPGTGFVKIINSDLWMNNAAWRTSFSKNNYSNKLSTYLGIQNNKLIIEMTDIHNAVY